MSKIEEYVVDLCNRVVLLESKVKALEASAQESLNLESVTVKFIDNGNTITKSAVKGSLITPPSEGKWAMNDNKLWNFNTYRVKSDLTLTKK